MSDKRHLIAIVFSFFAIYIIWGSTYLFVAYAVEEIPPFKMASLRFFLAALIIFIFSPFLINWKEVKWEEVKHAMIAGFMFLTLGNGAMCYALQYLDSGFSALLISSQPLILILMMRIIDKIAIKPKALVGVALGIIGMYLLVSQKELVSKPNQWKGLIAMLSCLFTWGYASLYVTKVKLPKSILVNSAIQMAFASVSLLLLSLLVRESSTDWLNLSSMAWYSVLYLVVFGSIIAFTAFNFLLQYVSPEKVATSTYVNPLVALFLGWYFRNEILSAQSILAAAILLTGVYFINTNKTKKLESK